jgi:hypothetical protein
MDLGFLDVVHWVLVLSLLIETTMPLYQLLAKCSVIVKVKTIPLVKLFCFAGIFNTIPL